MADADLAAQPASAGHVIPGSAKGDGVTIIELRGLALATLQARRGQSEALRSRIATTYQLDLPDRPAIAHGRDVAFVGMAPQTWLAISESDASLVRTLKTSTAGVASVSDQSGGYAVFRVTGPAVRAALAKGFPIDLEPTAFKVGDAATTVVGHIGASIWRNPDDADGSPVFEISVFRSLTRSFLDWFAGSAAEFGCHWR
ncbi:sarcosine oxidase subunit gamma [Rhodopseudomonas palustris]|uniref:Sarcosine oxidase subunit gamma n=1 Tax=Rhodopseudomonas palustris TaxID=1076 RepID=A0A418VJK5_RHOPL|nr:sarcosine oxidase subunit gamma family protein [Rhodopseudomonas palustris]RJF76340.1 sarcosine oxidase subunit gamma [Rhodopseudomonas palustris]